jgi:PAS domain S-box
MEKAVDGLMTDNYKSISTISNMMEAIERQDGAILIYLSIDRVKGLNLFEEKYSDFVKWNQVEVNNVTEKGEEKLVEELNQQYKKYIEQFTELQEVYNTKGQKPAASFYVNDILPHFYDIKKSLNDLSSMNEKAMFNSREAAVVKAKLSLKMLLLLSFLAVMGGYILARYFVNKFLEPLRRLTSGISRVKAGELGQQLVISSNDEAGELAKEFNEMTERLKNYEKSTLGTLMTEKNKSMAIIKSISDPLFALDANFRIILINNAAEAFYEIDESKAIGRHFLEIIRNGEIFDHIANAGDSGEERCEKIVHISKEVDYYFNVVVTPVKDPERKNTGYIVALQDVTELKKLERVKTDFIATISHEFKTPLTSVIMAASMLAEQGMGPLNDEQKETVDTIKEEGDKLTDLVNELLELSRIESGKAVYDIAACSIDAIAESSISGFREQAEHKNVALLNEMGKGLPLVAADCDKVRWVLNNLLSNALKYTGAGDTIIVASKVDREYVYVSVKDTGSGIPAEYLDSIFDKFVRVKDRDIEVRGTGLGLSVAREIISAHGGTIKVESKLEEGSTFTFTLPLFKTEVTT